MFRFFLVTGIGLAIINGWISWWLWRALSGTGWLRIALCILVLALGAAFPLLYKGHGDTLAHVWLIRAGAFWMGVAFYAFALVLLADIWGLAARLFGALPPVTPRWGAVLLVMGLPLLLGVGSWFNAAFPALRHYDITVRSQGPVPITYVDKPLKLGVITDMHLGRLITAGRLSRAVELLAPEQPDAILYVGDIIDDHIKLDAEATAAALAVAQPRLGHWAVPGNHEYISGSIDKSLDFLRAVGMQVLRDQWAVVDNSFVLAGRDDLSKPGFTGIQRGSMEEILADLPEQYRSLPLMVMDHQPAALDEARQAGTALMLSGHTHNGQLWPFNFVTELRYENPLGLLTKGNFHSIVSAGTGTWGPPLRTTGRAEVLLVTVHFTSADNAAP
ncbi:metallophosphoesterase [Desulfovibrio sp. UIB00]|uniref:metallophosphoesterase n=1 Tax=Desulfovibrio sp. UIB00 TaxID=2804314 RepID=UPI001F10C451|nr:metallophosphoesterase [Desulfovibrio sp. UIB00]MCH5145429.1 metallophosphoesterase [Desulfovibrio sp. UIB00]